MEEKLLIRGRTCFSKGKMGIVLAIVTLVFIITLCATLNIDVQNYAEEYTDHMESNICDSYGIRADNHDHCAYNDYGSAEMYGLSEALFNPGDVAIILRWLLLIPYTTFVVLWIIAFLCFSSNEIVVTNKRVYGKRSFGRQIDLPNDSISAVAISWFKGIAVATSAGKVSFYMIKERNEVYKCIKHLMVTRQSNVQPTAPVTKETNISVADELKKYKELLDMGIITQEEFDAKKNQLLGL